MQRSITTSSPPASAREAASSLEIPCCSQSRRAPIRTELSAMDGVRLRSAEHVDDVDLFGDVFQGGVGLLAEHVGFVGVHRNDAVADCLEPAHDAVRRAVRFRGRAHDRDGLGFDQESP